MYVCRSELLDFRSWFDPMEGQLCQISTHVHPNGGLGWVGWDWIGLSVNTIVKLAIWGCW